MLRAGDELVAKTEMLGLRVVLIGAYLFYRLPLVLDANIGLFGLYAIFVFER